MCIYLPKLVIFNFNGRAFCDKKNVLVKNLCFAEECFVRIHGKTASCMDCYAEHSEDTVRKPLEN